MSSEEAGEVWVKSINGFGWMELLPPDGRTIHDIDGICDTLGRMDGQKLFALLIARLPDGITFDTARFADHVDEFLQCAGRADAMVVERRRAVDGGFEHHVLAARTALAGDEGSVAITWSDRGRTQLAPHEVHTAATAAALFRRWYAGDPLDDVPSRAMDDTP